MRRKIVVELVPEFHTGHKEVGDDVFYGVKP